MAIGTEEHPGRVRTTCFGVGVRQYFGSVYRPSFSTNANQQMMDELATQGYVEVSFICSPLWNSPLS